MADLRRGRIVVWVDGVAILIVRSRGRLSAMLDRCPHLAQPLSTGRVRGGWIECAGHGYRWDLDTGDPTPCARGTAATGLAQREVREVAGRIMLAASAGPASS